MGRQKNLIKDVDELIEKLSQIVKEKDRSNTVIIFIGNGAIYDYKGHLLVEDIWAEEIELSYEEAIKNQMLLKKATIDCWEDLVEKMEDTLDDPMWRKYRDLSAETSGIVTIHVETNGVGVEEEYFQDFTYFDGQDEEIKKDKTEKKEIKQKKKEISK